jgi:DNA-binding NtrC family response regulator
VVAVAVIAKATAIAVKMGETMEPVSVVLYQNDVRTGQILANSLAQHFQSVHLARSHEELRPTIARNRAQVLVLDMEKSFWGEVERLHREFPSLSIVCTHRLADEELWAEALNQGAADICEPRQDEVVRSVMRERAQRAAA